jgi:uncharacterized protein (TIGR03437 family)
MRNLIVNFLLFCAIVAAQTAEVHYFVADMRGANEVPPITTTDNAGALVIVHAVRNPQGEVISGTVEFNLRATFAEASTITGLHIHSGVAGVNGPVVIDSGIRSAEPVQATAGLNVLTYSGQVRADAAAALAALRGVLANPNAYYLNLHTTVSPGGRVRGQLFRAESTVLLSDLSSANEVPPVATPATGVGAFLALRAYDGNGRFVAGAGVFTANYNLGSQQRFTGWHLHRGPAGANGPVVLDSGLQAAQQLDSPASGTGSLQRWITYLPEATAAVAALNDIFDNPGAFYMNLHTASNPGGMIRGQMLASEPVAISLNMTPGDEVPPVTDLDASATSLVAANLIRNGAGVVTHALLHFSLNYRFPGPVTFVGLHIHEGAAGVNGPVRLDSGITGANNVPTDGFGNISRSFAVSSEVGLAAVNALLANPENYYLNLHSTVHPGGAVRGQLAPANTRRPRVVDFISGVSDATLRTAAQGGLMTVFGYDLFKIPSTPVSVPELPARLNGTRVTVGGREARLWMMGRDPAGDPTDYIVVQVPFDAPTGAQTVVVTNSNGEGNAFATTVAATAPALFFDALGVIALRADLTLVRPDAPARAGELIGLLATGLGQTAPALADGEFAGAANAVTAATITATIGGRPAPVVAAQALPGYVGVYLVGIAVPEGLTPGNAMAQIRAGNVASNMAALPVR